MKRPSGDQQGGLRRLGRGQPRKPVPFTLATQISGLPALLSTIATRFPSGDGRVMLEPEKRATVRRCPVRILCVKYPGCA